MKNMIYTEMKQELKEIAEDIREWKSRRKQDRREGYALYVIEDKIECLGRDFRFKHIAMSMYRGHEYEMIESNTPLSKYELNRYVQPHLDELNSGLTED